MDLYEFEGKAFLARLGIPTPRGVFCQDAREAVAAARQVGLPCVIKSQVLTGGRGKAGGVSFVDDLSRLETEVDRILALPINGNAPVGVLVESKLQEGRELYAAVAFDASLSCPVLLFSPRGGVHVESDSGSLLRIPVSVGELSVTPSAWVTSELIARAPAGELEGLTPPLLDKLGTLLAGLLAGYCGYDLELLEINPLIMVGEDLIAADAKVTVDDDALFRQEGLVVAARPPLGELEARAKAASLQYVDLDGEICLMANGAGLNLLLLDVVAAFGSSSANFLDTGGGASTIKTYEGVRILQDRGLRDSKVRARVIMLSLAITRAREAAEGVVKAISERPDDPVPTFAVVHGAGAEEGRRILEEANITVAPDIRSAVEWATRTQREA
ncbi:MAG: ATP-grasp domain-containing protein [Thermoleophilia bacterium]